MGFAQKEKELIYNGNKLTKKSGNEFPVNIYNISIIVPVNAREKPE